MMLDPIADAKRVIHLQNAVAILAVLSMGLVPWCVDRWLSRREHGKYVLHEVWRVLGGIASFVYVLAALLFTTCGFYQIGGSGEWKLSQAYGEPVSAALARYRDRHGAYPDSLAQLAPAFLSRESLVAPESSSLRAAFEYKRDSLGYQLKLGAGTPGWNECEHRPGKAWKCGGHF